MDWQHPSVMDFYKKRAELIEAQTKERDAFMEQATKAFLEISEDERKARDLRPTKEADVLYTDEVRHLLAAFVQSAVIAEKEGFAVTREGQATLNNAMIGAWHIAGESHAAKAAANER